jgi:hypothetical protein
MENKKSVEMITKKVAVLEVLKGLTHFYYVLIGNLIILAIIMFSVYLFQWVTLFIITFGIIGNGYYFGRIKKHMKYLKTKYNII